MDIEFNSLDAENDDVIEIANQLYADLDQKNSYIIELK